MRSGLSQVLQHLMKSGIGTYLAVQHLISKIVCAVLQISAWVFEESAGAKKLLGNE